MLYLYEPVYPAVAEAVVVLIAVVVVVVSPPLWKRIDVAQKPHCCSQISQLSQKESLHVRSLSLLPVGLKSHAVELVRPDERWYVS